MIREEAGRGVEYVYRPNRSIGGPPREVFWLSCADISEQEEGEKISRRIMRLSSFRFSLFVFTVQWFRSHRLLYISSIERTLTFLNP